MVLRVNPGSETCELGGCSAIHRCSTAGFVLGYEATEVLRRRSGPYPFVWDRILILLFGIGLYVVWFFGRLGGAVDVILRENMKRRPGNIRVVSKGRQDQPSGRTLPKHRSAACDGQWERVLC